MRKSARAAIVAISIAAALASCSTRSSAHPTTSPPAPDGSGNPAAKLVIDGTQRSLRGTPNCSEHAGGLAISAGDEPNDVFIRLIPWNSPLLVGEISFGSGFTGTKLAYDGKADGSDVTSAMIGEGDDHQVHYSIHGDATTTAAPQDEQAKSFELELTCD
jgi:hypothetical protein